MKVFFKTFAVSLLVCLCVVVIGYQWVKPSKAKDVENVAIHDIEPLPEFESLGVFVWTAYCSCEFCCGEWALNRPIDENGKEIVIGAIGERLTPEYSVAVDPNVIPYGTVFFDEDGRQYIAQDCGGAIKEARIDLYFDDHQKAKEFGIQTKEIFTIKEAENELQ